MLLLIGDFDCTPMILAGDYQMQQEDVYHEWEDGNGKRHRVIYTTRISGTVGLKPKTQTQYNNLIQALKSKKRADGSYILTVFVNNLNKFELIEAYVRGDFVLGKNTGRKWWESISLEIEEQ